MLFYFFRYWQAFFIFENKSFTWLYNFSSHPVTRAGGFCDGKSTSGGFLLSMTSSSQLWLHAGSTWGALNKIPPEIDLISLGFSLQVGTLNSPLGDFSKESKLTTTTITLPQTACTSQWLLWDLTLKAVPKSPF
jgi:hypothetical protein